MPGSDSREASAKEPKSHIEVAETLAVPLTILVTMAKVHSPCCASPSLATPPGLLQKLEARPLIVPIAKKTLLSVIYRSILLPEGASSTHASRDPGPCWGLGVPTKVPGATPGTLFNSSDPCCKLGILMKTCKHLAQGTAVTENDSCGSPTPAHVTVTPLPIPSPRLGRALTWLSSWTPCSRPGGSLSLCGGPPAQQPQRGVRQVTVCRQGPLWGLVKTEAPGALCSLLSQSKGSDPQAAI